MRCFNKLLGLGFLVSSSFGSYAYAECTSTDELMQARDDFARIYQPFFENLSSLIVPKSRTFNACGNTIVLNYNGLGSGEISDFSAIVNSRDFGWNEGISAFLSALNVPDSGEAELSGQVAQSRQITRQITSTVARRISRNIVRAFSDVKFQNKEAASSDTSESLAFWGETNLSQITEDDGQSEHIDNDIYQFTGGFDKGAGDLFFGAALTYAYSENEQINLDSVSNTVGITPYLAYKITDYMYVSGLAGYNYTGVIALGPDTDIHEYYAEADITLFKEIHSFILKGRAGVRYNHSFASIQTGTDNSADELTWIADAEVDYKFSNGLITYTGVLFEYYDREASNSNVATSAYHEGVFYMRWGADYPIADKITIGANIETDLNNHDTSLISGGIHFRMEI